jgi:glutamate racemase
MLLRNGIVRAPGLPAPEHRFLTTGSPGAFRDIGQRFLGPELDIVDQFAWVGV